jgi:hypothetical protein
MTVFILALCVLAAVPLARFALFTYEGLRVLRLSRGRVRKSREL